MSEDLLVRDAIIEKVKGFEEILLQLPQVDLNTTHSLAGEVYSRTIFIPAGVTLTGAIHNKDHVNIMCGDITVSTDTGMKRLRGYHVFPTKAGMKRVGYAHADTYWTTVLQTKETELSKIEEDITPEYTKLQTSLPGITSKINKFLEGN
jgi:cytoskeletal protein CcmA (bactofilin family)